MKAWNLKQLHEYALLDIQMCHTAHERLMCKVINGIEIRKTAVEISLTRKLTPCEQAILSLY